MIERNGGCYELSKGILEYKFDEIWLSEFSNYKGQQVTLNINTDVINNDSDYKKIGLFIALALALHNFPEGIAIGVGIAGKNALGFMIASAMLLHNIPEGISIAMLNISRINNDKLEVGNVITIEPGIYIESEFGVRIEDMVFVTENGCENLTKSQKSLIVL